MAVVRTRSTPPYGLFAAVALAVITTAGAVVFYVMWAKASDDLKTATDSNGKLGTAADIRTFQTANPGADAKLTFLGQANKLIASLRDEGLVAKHNLENMTAERDSLAGNINEYKDMAAKATNERKATLAQTTNELNSVNGSMAELKKQLDGLSAGSTQAVAARDKAVAEAQAAFNKIVDDMEKLRRDTVIQREEDQSTIARLNAEIRDLRIRITNMGGHGVNSDVGEADGTIIRVNGATGEVYIDLGKKDRIMPGMTFTAYDPRTGVRYTSDEAALGNGSLEVIEVGDTTSLCRITRTSKNRAIQAHDLIANLVYHNDRSRKFRFTVLGNFDLDGDGVATAAERDRIILLIKGWGGQVDDDVSSQTDYLVVGAKPASPTPAFDQAADTPTTEPATQPAAATGSIAAVAVMEQDRYEDLVIQAKRLAIPVLNANRFLSMIGYYNTTVVRY